MTRLAVLGLGLIGGSIARALAAREPADWHATAWSRTPAGPAEAVADGVVSAAAASPEAAVRDADLVLLAASPAANLELVGRIGPGLASRGVPLTDVSSVQVPIGAAASTVAELRFVGGHPMAGTERRGYAAARPDLFVGRPWIVLPGPAATEADVALVRSLAVSCGAVPRLLDPATHDRLVAAISHLPLVVSAALAETVIGAGAWEDAAPLAAGGWRDMTRLARGNAELGGGIATLNRDELAGWLDRLAGAVTSWRAMLTATGGPDAAAVAARLEAVRETLERGAPAQADAAVRDPGSDRGGSDPDGPLPGRREGA